MLVHLLASALVDLILPILRTSASFFCSHREAIHIDISAFNNPMTVQCRSSSACLCIEASSRKSSLEELGMASKSKKKKEKKGAF